VQTVAGWATGFVSGSADEVGQHVLEYRVISDSNPALFAVAPAIDTAGLLTYTPRPDTHGTAAIGVVVRDDSGTAQGGVDTSVAHSFTITITPAYRSYLPFVAR
jgi:hypothetical protein